MKQRTILFRIRDIFSESFLDTKNGLSFSCGQLKISNKGIDAFITNNSFRIEQFTGVLDSKGTFIYEGDVVDIIQEGEKHTGRIGFSGGSFWVYGKTSFPLLQTYSDEITVIGNIWTMPEFNKE